MNNQTKKELKETAKNIADAIESSFELMNDTQNEYHSVVSEELCPELWMWWHAEADSMSCPGSRKDNFPSHILTVNRFLELARHD